MSKIKLIAISAVSMNGVIGVNGKIPWHIPEDYKHFRNTTIGHTLIVGQNTYSTLPSKAFEGRKYVILDNMLDDEMEINNNHYKFKNIDKAIEYLNDNVEIFGNNIFVIGGELIYKSLIDKCDEAIITWINEISYDGDKYFPIEKLFNNFEIINDGDWIKSISGNTYKITHYIKSLVDNE